MHRHTFARRALLVSTIAAAFVVPARAQDFRLQVGPPAAAAPQAGAIFERKVGKDAVLVVQRPVGCSDPAQARITVTAEGLIDDGRRSVALQLVPLPSPGTHAVPAPWPDGRGVWILSLSGTCAGRAAGAIVRLGPQQVYRRDRVELMAHHPTPEQVDRALRLSARDGGPGVSSR